MTTYADLVNRVRQQLLGYAQDQVALAELAQPMVPGDVTFSVSPDTVGNLSQGLVEIDDELVIVKNYSTSGVVTVMGGANGRGASGTTAASHDPLALISTAPQFPRQRVKEAVNESITGTYPDLVAFGYAEITNVSVVYQYEMPADAMDVWAVSSKTIGPTQVWNQGTRWRFDPSASPGSFPTGKSIQLFDAVTPGQTMRIKYTKAPSILTDPGDDFESVSGLPDRCSDLIVWSACSRILPAYEAARLQQQSIEATERAALVPPKSAAQTAAYYYQLYQQRLLEERNRLYQDNPQPTYYAS